MRRSLIYLIHLRNKSFRTKLRAQRTAKIDKSAREKGKWRFRFRDSRERSLTV